MKVPFEFPAKSRSVLTDLVVWSGRLLSLCPTLVPNPSEATTTGIIAQPVAGHVLAVALLSQHSSVPAEEQTRSRCCWQRLDCVQNEAYSTPEFLFPRACVSCASDFVDSFGCRPMGQLLEVRTASLKYPSVLILIWFPLTRMYHTWVNLFNPKTYLQAEVALSRMSLCTNEYISRANLLSTPPAPSISWLTA